MWPGIQRQLTREFFLILRFSRHWEFQCSYILLIRSWLLRNPDVASDMEISPLEIITALRMSVFMHVADEILSRSGSIVFGVDLLWLSWHILISMSLVLQWIGIIICGPGNTCDGANALSRVHCIGVCRSGERGGEKEKNIFLMSRFSLHWEFYPTTLRIWMCTHTIDDIAIR